MQVVEVIKEIPVDREVEVPPPLPPSLHFLSTWLILTLSFIPSLSEPRIIWLGGEGDSGREGCGEGSAGKSVRLWRPTPPRHADDFALHISLKFHVLPNCRSYSLSSLEYYGLWHVNSLPGAAFNAHQRQLSSFQVNLNRGDFRHF